jgi:hypothetical protein
MPKQTYRKLDIAHEYLTIAAELYFAERYFPALALAAMAEEIFEAVMRARCATSGISSATPQSLARRIPPGFSLPGRIYEEYA